MFTNTLTCKVFLFSSSVSLLFSGPISLFPLFFNALSICRSTKISYLYSMTCMIRHLFKGNLQWYICFPENLILLLTKLYRTHQGYFKYTGIGIVSVTGFLSLLLICLIVLQIIYAEYTSTVMTVVILTENFQKIE